MPRPQANPQTAPAPGPWPRLRRALLSPVDAGPLASFRIGFGLLMLWQAMEFLLGGRLERFFLAPLFHFKYPGFGWLEPLPDGWMRLLFWIFAAACAGIALGWHYRLSAATFTLIYTYQFLLDEAIYNNHDYLIALLGLLLTVVPAHAAFSLDARRRRGVASDTVPAWALWLLRFQIAIPYVYGGIAKLDADWLLRAQPLTLWMRNPGPGQWRPAIFYEEWMAYALSWGGMLLDLLVVPALLWRKTRPLAVVALITFHLMNSQLFVIGVFPWLMICSLVLFIEPATLRRFRLIPRPRGAGSPRRKKGGAATGSGAVASTAAADPPLSPRGKVAAALLAIYVLLQLVVPFRHLLYPGDVDWTEEGHQFAWRMKLRDKEGDLSFLAVQPGQKRAVVLTGVEEVLTVRQRQMMRHDPEMIRQFAHRLAEGLRERGEGDVEVRVVSSISLNGLPEQPMVDPEVDLGSEPASLGPAAWIMPLTVQPGPDG